MTEVVRIKAGLFAGLALAALCYSLGLGGGFWLDDYATLDMLSQWGQIDSLDKFIAFLDSGFAGPTGRPVSLISFALQSQSWPANPKDFLLVNIVIHLLNGGLVYLFVSALLVQQGKSKLNVIRISVFSALIWLVHPLLVSSVLYVVQRMVLLAAFFNLLALYCYLQARNQAIELNGSSLPSRWTFIYAFLFALFSISAIFSKENAALIFLQLVIVEWYLKSYGAVQNSYFIWFRRLAVWMPAYLLIGYLLYQLGKHSFHWLLTGEEYVLNRSFSFSERLLTELRIIGEYLVSILFPRAQSGGVFNDNYPISTSLLSPISTLFWLLGHSIILFFCIRFRKACALVSFGILWFYVNHLLESTVLMLELKFEHRNYMPALGIVLALSAAINEIKQIKYQYIIYVTIIVLLSGLLAMRTTLWGNPMQASLVWVQESPDSPRALESAALVLAANPANREIVQELLFKAKSLAVDDGALDLKYRLAVCADKQSINIDNEQLLVNLQNGGINWQITGIMQAILVKMQSGVCSQFSLDSYKRLLTSIRSNKRYNGTSIAVSMTDLEARAELYLGDRERAIKIYLSMDYQNLNLGFIMNQALLLANSGEETVALKHLTNGIEKCPKDSKFLLEQALDMKNRIAKNEN